MRIGLLGDPVRIQGGVQHQGRMKYRVKFLGFTVNEQLQLVMLENSSL
jgi:hypothetical protein